MRVFVGSIIVAGVVGVASTASASPVECHVINDTAGPAGPAGVPAGGSFTAPAPRLKTTAHGAPVDV